MSTYKGATPSSPSIDSRVTKFFENFYAMSDSPTNHEDYANALTKDATFIMGSRKAVGYDEILELRKGLWKGAVKKRKHTLEQIYPFGEDSTQVMVYGSVDYVLTNGKDLNVEWAGRARFVEDEGQLKMKHYQVYLDSAPVANAMK